MAGRDDEGTEGVLRSRPRHRKPMPCGPVERGNRHPVAAPPPPDETQRGRLVGPTGHRLPQPCGHVERGNRYPVAAPPPPDEPDEAQRGRVVGSTGHRVPQSCGPVERGNRHPVAPPPPPDEPDEPYVEQRFHTADGKPTVSRGPEPSPGVRAREARGRGSWEVPDPGYRVAPAPPPPEPGTEGGIRRVIDGDAAFRPWPGSRSRPDRLHGEKSPILRDRWGRRIIRDDLWSDLDRSAREDDGAWNGDESLFDRGGWEPWELPGPTGKPSPPTEGEDGARDGAATLSIEFSPDLAVPPNAQFHTYRKDDQPQFRLSVTGQRDEATTLYLWVFRNDDWSELVVDPPPSFLVPAGSDDWSEDWIDPPYDDLGHYRVVVAGDSGADWQPPGSPTTHYETFFPPPGIRLPAQGTRPRDHFTYAIVPDPDRERDEQAPAQRFTFFGLNGAFKDQPVLPWLGGRWVDQFQYWWGQHPNPEEAGFVVWNGGLIGGLSDAPNDYYSWLDPDLGAVQRWDSSPFVPPGSNWDVYLLPSLLVTNVSVDQGGGSPDWMNDFWGPPGPMVEGSYGVSGRGGRPLANARWSGVEAWVGYAFQAAKKFSSENLGMVPRLYQITWEPSAFYGYRGEEIVAPGGQVPAYQNVKAERELALDGLGQVYGVAFEQVLAGEVAGAGDERAMLLGPTWESLYRTSVNGELSWDPGPPPDPSQPWNWFSQLQAPNLGYRNSPYFTQQDLLVHAALDRFGNEFEDPSAPGEPLRVVDVLDGFSIHPYMRGGYLPSTQMGSDYIVDGQVMAAFDQDVAAGIRALDENLSALRSERGRMPLPIYATEFGFSTCDHGETDDIGQTRWGYDRTQALALVRQNLVLLGEGVRVAMSFQVRDYRGGAGVRQFGLYYNLEGSIYVSGDDSWKTGELGPRPAVPAYAAMTSILEGFRPVGTWNEALEDQYGLDGVFAYAFLRGYDEVALALWSPAGPVAMANLEPVLTSLGIRPPPAGLEPVRNPRRCDWMGNAVPLDLALPLTLGPEPTYVVGLRAGPIPEAQ
jgi:hypothetical protein